MFTPAARDTQPFPGWRLQADQYRIIYCRQHFERSPDRVRIGTYCRLSSEMPCLRREALERHVSVVTTPGSFEPPSIVPKIPPTAGAETIHEIVIAGWEFQVAMVGYLKRYRLHVHRRSDARYSLKIKSFGWHNNPQRA